MLFIYLFCSDECIELLAASEAFGDVAQGQTGGGGTALALTSPLCSWEVIKGLPSEPAAPQAGCELLSTQSLLLHFARCYPEVSIRLGK